jgi:hypothetical protein
MARMHGEHKQDYAARQAAAAERKARPAEVSAAKVEIPTACRCPWRPYPHFVTDEGAKAAHARAGWGR